MFNTNTNKTANTTTNTAITTTNTTITTTTTTSNTTKMHQTSSIYIFMGAKFLQILMLVLGIC